jgi:hypothetical protein
MSAPAVSLEMRNTILNEPVGAIQAVYRAEPRSSRKEESKMLKQKMGGAHMGRKANSVRPALTGERDELRQKILKMSLFPNIYNRSTLEAQS